MKVRDPLYGVIEVDEPIARLLMTPEVRRLSQVRLLNCLTPSLATLGELRRYAHTLGVLRLSQNVQMGRHSDERLALQAAVLLHDIGTPPFGHLFEYELRDRFGWNHERVIADVLWGFHAPENKAHQFFMGSTIAFAKRLGSVGISRDLVVEIVRGRHPLSSLLFGSLDLDNIDNVLRMAWALGEPSDQGLGLGLAKELRISDDGSVRCAERNRHLIVRWLSIRRRVYEVLVFDMPTVAAQAVLAEAINIGFEEGWLTDLDWTLTDEQLLDLLRSKTPTKRLIQEQYLSELPTPLFVLQLGLELGDLGFKDRGAVQRHIRVAIKKEAPDLDPLAYAFVDRGAFEKRCTFVDPNGTPWEEGSSSKSVVLYGFSQGRTPVPARQAEKVLRAIVASLGISEEQILKASSMSSQEGNGQTAFTFSH